MTALLRALLAPSIAVAIAATLITAHASDARLASDDLGIAPDLVLASTVVYTPAGTLAGPDGVETYIASLRDAYPDAEFAVTAFQAIGNLLIIDWQGERDGEVVHTGRTLANVEAGGIAEIFFVDAGSVAPPTAAPAATIDTTEAIAPEGISPDDIVNAPAPEAFAKIEAIATSAD